MGLLTVACATCHTKGEGTRPGHDGRVDVTEICSACSGVGSQLTDLGREVLAMIQAAQESIESQRQEFECHATEARENQATYQENELRRLWNQLDAERSELRRAEARILILEQKRSDRYR